MRRSSLVLLVLLLAACRAEAPREGARSPATGRTSDLSAARTDGCSQTRGQRPDTSIRLGTPAADRWRHAMARGAEYRCVVHPSLTLRLRLVGDTTHPSLDSIVVLPETESADVLQVLHREPGDAEMPLPYHTDVLSTFDLDADGFRDLLVGKFWGATGNRGYDVWRFDPVARRFVADSALSKMWNPSPIAGRRCVSTYSNSSARDNGTGVYCLHDGRWRLDSAEMNSWNRDSNSVTRSIMVRRGDTLVVVKTETRPDSM
ncbi:MAG TPA: hypothetical protein VKA54_05280 [Gemmatimonadaceae bacterium]|nr:hypothetical protein [Gemmatimonadaceae bacterium]